MAALEQSIDRLARLRVRLDCAMTGLLTIIVDRDSVCAGDDAQPHGACFQVHPTINQDSCTDPDRPAGVSTCFDQWRNGNLAHPGRWAGRGLHRDDGAAVALAQAADSTGHVRHNDVQQ